MIKSSLLTSSLGVLGMLVMLSCEEPVKPVAGPAVTDIDGNVYPSVVIGLQTWMARDLVVTRYNEGSQIPWIQDPESWQYLTAGAYCIRPGLEPHIGALYNKYAVGTYRLAPVGWHIPSHTELMILLDYLGGQNVAGEKIRSRTGWQSPDVGVTNESGFSAFPGGWRKGDGTFVYDQTAIWALSDMNSGFRLGDGPGVFVVGFGEKDGFLIRCIKD